DIFATSAGSPVTSKVYLNRGDGTFYMDWESDPGSKSIAEDVNNDGMTDIVSITDSGTVAVSLNGFSSSHNLSYGDVVQALYVAYFGRPADSGGWTNFEAALSTAAAPSDLQGLNSSYNSNATVKYLVDAFGTSAESNALYTGSTADFVNAIYAHVLNRASDSAGLQFWVNAIDSGILTKGNAALSIMAGALANTTPQGLIDAQVVTKKVAIGTAFTASLSTATQSSAYSGDAAAATVRTMLSTVTSATDTTAFQSSIDSTVSSLVTAALVRTTQFGQVSGALSSVSSSYVWLGIPYAAPPTGANRWKAPSNPTPWSTTLNATSFGNACIQSTGGTAFRVKASGSATVASVNTPQSEDCLNLNIWAPTTGETNLPVLVYVHGGSNVTGYGGHYPQWGGTLAADQKVIFVSINYRLNVFGWLNHAALKVGDPLTDSGNFGTLDIIQALKFVKNNIANFGGDPNNVTLGGESAGANNTWTLLMSPQARGLFHKAMAMSGGLTTSHTPADGQTFATTLLKKLVITAGLAADDTSAATYLNGLSNAQIKDLLYNSTSAQLTTAFQNTGGTISDRFMDGTVLPPNNASALTGNYLNNVPLLVGNTNDEGKHWGSYFAVSTSAWNTLYAGMVGAATLPIDQIVNPTYMPVDKAFTSCSNAGYNALNLNAAFVFANTSTWCANSFVNTTFFWWYQTISVNRYQPLQPKVYAYNFAWNQLDEPQKTLLASRHSGDIPFMFGNLIANAEYTNVGFNSASAAGRESVSSKMRNSLGAFMRTGDPNNASLGVTWLPWSVNGGSGANRLIFDADANNAIITMTQTNAPLSR
ncbi:MAG: carboxylesterase family protein, partial [Limisphaerales bacterium]